VEIPPGGGDGMIVTDGGRFGGYGLYLLKGKPVFTYNFLGPERFRWEGQESLTPGNHILERHRAKIFLWIGIFLDVDWDFSCCVPTFAANGLQKPGMTLERWAKPMQDQDVWRLRSTALRCRVHFDQMEREWR
jgi:hypothetical protein